jgi:hypothetical protein
VADKFYYIIKIKCKYIFWNEVEISYKLDLIVSYLYPCINFICPFGIILWRLNYLSFNFTVWSMCIDDTGLFLFGSRNLSCSSLDGIFGISQYCNRKEGSISDIEFIIFSTMFQLIDEFAKYIVDYQNFRDYSFRNLFFILLNIRVHIHNNIIKIMLHCLCDVLLSW